MCLAGAVVACWSLTQEMASSSPFAVMTNIFVTEYSVNSGKHLGKTPVGLQRYGFKERSAINKKDLIPTGI